jgi:glycerol kinase
MLIAAIDQGTTSTKCLLVDADGESTLIGAIRHKQILPHEGWVEHDAGELLANTQSMIDRAVAAGAEGVAIANQGETVVAWDRRTGAPLCNAIVWQDQRTAAFVEILRAAGHKDEVRAISGLPLDAYFSASKIHWILDEVPGAKELARAGQLGLGTSDAYFIERLTGEYATDPTTASRTSLMDLGTCEWDTRLAEIFSVPVEYLPRIGDGPFGEVTSGGRKIPLVASMVDQLAALYGHGCRAPGDAKVTFGTGAFALAITGHSRPENLPPGVVLTVGWKSGSGRVYAADGGVYTAGAAIEWLQRIGLLTDVSELERLGGPPAIARGIAFVPALAGLGCPHWDRSAAGLWLGIDSATGREDLVKAVLEGVAFRTGEVLEAMGSAIRSDGVLSVDGGLTRAPYFLQFFTDIAGREIVDAGERELTALGAGFLGHAARGIDASGGGEQQQRLTLAPRAKASDVVAWRARFNEARRRSTGWRDRDPV